MNNEFNRKISIAGSALIGLALLMLPRGAGAVPSMPEFVAPVSASLVASSATKPMDPGAGPVTSGSDKTASHPAVAAAPAAAPVAAVATRLLPSQSSAGSEAQKYGSNPRANELRDSMEREPAINGMHRLPNDAIAMMTGTSRIYDFATRVKRIAISDSKIADIQIVNPFQLMLIGHKPGFTTLSIWDIGGHYDEREIRVEKEGHQQVLLNVTVAEVNRSKMEQEGIDYSVAFTKLGISLASLPGNVQTPYSSQTNLTTSGPGGTSTGFIAPPGGNRFPLQLSSGITYALTTANSHTATDTFFQFLEAHDLGRILAEPRLLANSGEEAKFLSGGEIPIVIAQALNTSVVFKQFGTSVKFMPTVIGRNDIELVVEPEVSKPDFSQGVQLFGFTVPAFITRRASTDVRMRDGQTLIVAGLILTDTESKVNKVPYLGDIPFAGSLFRNTSYQQTRSELVVSVTPEIVRPIPENSTLVLPTDRGPMTGQEIRTEPVNPPDVTRPRLY